MSVTARHKPVAHIVCSSRIKETTRNIVNCKNNDSCNYRYKKDFFPSKFVPHRMLMESILEHKRGSSRQLPSGHYHGVKSPYKQPTDQSFQLRNVICFSDILTFCFNFHIFSPTQLLSISPCIVVRKSSAESHQKHLKHKVLTEEAKDFRFKFCITLGDLHYLHQHVKCCIHYQDLEVQAMKDKYTLLLCKMIGIKRSI